MFGACGFALVTGLVGREPKICQIHLLSGFVEQDVLGFKIPMDDIFGVQVVHSRENLKHILQGSSLVQAGVLRYQVGQRAPFVKLGDYVGEFPLVVHLVYL